MSADGWINFVGIGDIIAVSGAGGCSEYWRGIEVADPLLLKLGDMIDRMIECHAVAKLDPISGNWFFHDDVRTYSGGIWGARCREITALLTTRRLPAELNGRELRARTHPNSPLSHSPNSRGGTEQTVQLREAHEPN